MDGMTGMEAAKKLRKTNTDCLLVFTTTSTDHALEGFQVRALHYSPDGSMCALRGRQPRYLSITAVLRHFVPYKGVPPLRCLCSYPSALRGGNHLLTQTISAAKSEQLFH